MTGACYSAKIKWWCSVAQGLSLVCVSVATASYLVICCAARVACVAVGSVVAGVREWKW